MAQAHKARVGTVSHGTLVPTDLIDAFSGELRHLLGDTATKEQCDLLTAADTYLESDDAAADPDDLIDALTQELNDLAPPYCYFGTLEGDGAAFGFWPDMESINELPRVSDPSEVEKHLGEECAFVNDHGNVTVYAADGSVVLELV